MIDLFSLWQDFQSRVNTSQNSFFRPQTDFVRAVNETSIKLWNKWTGIAEKSQEEKDKLFPFLKKKNIVVNGAASYYGFAQKPKDYGRLASARIVIHKDKTYPAKDIDGGKCEGWKTDEEIKDEYLDNVHEAQVTIVDNQRWAAYCQHLTKGPTMERPGITQINDGFQVAPRKISVIALDYYIEPTPATFEYTLSSGNTQTGAGDQIIYNSSTSVKLQWPEQVRNEFLDELVNWFTMYTRDQLGNSINLSQKQLK